MATPEAKVKAAIKKLLNQYGVYSHMPVQNGMGAPTLDFVCCYKGLYIGIEAKANGKQPTERQRKTMRQISKAGGVAIWVDETRLEALEKLLIQLQNTEVRLHEGSSQPET